MSDIHRVTLSCFLPFIPNHIVDNLQVVAVEIGLDINARGCCGLVSVSQAVSGKWLHVSDNAQKINRHKPTAVCGHGVRKMCQSLPDR